MAKVIFLSPHYDDVILSCSGLIQRLVQQDDEVIVVTVFTADQSERIIENNRALEILKVRGISIDMPDAPERDLIKNRNGQILFGNPALDPITLKLIQEKICKIQAIEKAQIIYSPLGIGWHIDHLIVSEASQVLKDCKLRFYEDTPYNWIPSQASLRVTLPSSNLIEQFLVDILQAYYVKSFIPHWTKEHFEELLREQLLLLTPMFKKDFVCELSQEERKISIEAIQCYRSQIVHLFKNSDELEKMLRNFPEKYYTQLLI